MRLCKILPVLYIKRVFLGVAHLISNIFHINIAITRILLGCAMLYSQVSHVGCLNVTLFGGSYHCSWLMILYLVVGAFVSVANIERARSVKMVTDPFWGTKYPTRKH